jgi:hypothetical protein
MLYIRSVCAQQLLAFCACAASSPDVGSSTSNTLQSGKTNTRQQNGNGHGNAAASQKKGTHGNTSK